ncbi:MAG: hypothetical protein AAB951_01395 [Patescibacteria group bacterium]
MERPIEGIRAEVKRDYDALATLLKLPEALGFEYAVVATKIGMVSPDSYPFKEFQQAFIEHVARLCANDEAFTDAFEIVTGVWNHFPHDDLGMSPIERMRADVAAGAPPIDYDALREDLTSDEGVERMHVAVDKRLEFLSEVAQSYLEHYLPSVGGTKKDVNAILKILADPTRDPNEALKYMIIDMTAERKKKKTRARVTIADMQPVVRVLTTCENHIVSVMDNGHKNSRMFQNIARQCVENMANQLAEDRHSGKAAGSITLVEPIDALDMLLDIHAAISETAKRLRATEGLEEAAHHILDWIALTDVQEIIGREPNERAAHILTVARLIAVTGDPKRPFTALAPKLYSASGYTDDTAYAAEIARLAEIALTNCGDPAQMMPVPGQEPDDCDKRLTALAPSLKLRSPISPDDLSMPSPFI